MEKEIASQLSRLDLDEYPPSVQQTKRVIKESIKRFNKDKFTIVNHQDLPYGILYHVMFSDVSKVTVFVNDVNVAKEITRVAYEREILREQLTRHDKSREITIIIDSKWIKINVYDTSHLKTLKDVDCQLLVVDADAPFNDHYLYELIVPLFMNTSSDLHYLISVENVNEFLV